MEACENLSYNLLFASTFYKGNTLTFSDVLRSEALGGILSYGDIDRIVLSQIQSLNIPIVVLDSSRRTGDMCFSVQVDYEDAAFTATRHLIDLGHRDIAFIGNDKLHTISTFWYSKDSGAPRAEANIALGTNRIQLKRFRRRFRSAPASTRRSPARNCRPRCFARRTFTPCGARSRKLYHLRIRVPDDISVIVSTTSSPRNI
jgi:DNA-binding LacI/PurR family transcriptional regulator